MRIAALVLGLLGSLILFLVGVLWTDNAEHLQEVEAMAQTAQTVAKEAAAAGQGARVDAATSDLQRSLDVVRGKARASYAMAGAGLVAFIGSFFVIKFPKVSGAIMALAVIGPAVLYVGSLLASFLLAPAALLALLAKPKPPKAVAAGLAAAFVIGSAAVGFAADGAPAAAPEPTAIKASCSHLKTLSVCDDYTADAFKVLGDGIHKSGCTASNGIWTATTCPTAKAAGTCLSADGQYRRYYDDGNIPYKADSAAKDCKDLQNGKWLGAPKPAAKK